MQQKIKLPKQPKQTRYFNNGQGSAARLKTPVPYKKMAGPEKPVKGLRITEAPANYFNEFLPKR